MVYFLSQAVAISPSNLIIFLILFFRISLFNLPSFQIDMSLWQAWTQRLYETGIPYFYSADYFSDYFPGFLYILWSVGNILSILGESINSNLFENVIKAISTLFDFATAILLFRIVKSYKKKLAEVATILYLLNPAIIFNSSVWGQIDGIFTFFLITATYFLIEKKDFIKSNLAYSLAILIKPHSLALLPLIIFDNIKQLKTSRDLLKLAIIPIFIFLFSFPFFIRQPLAGLFELAIKAGNVYPYSSLFAFNFWSLFGFWEKDSLTFLNISYQAWGIILYLAAISALVSPLIWVRLKDKFYLYLVSAISFLIFFLFLTRMHERYLFPFFIFILIAAIIKKSKILLTTYILGSIIHFVNLWYVYYYYNFVYKGIGETNETYLFINSNYKIFSLILLGIFAYLFFYYYRSLFPTFKPKIGFK